MFLYDILKRGAAEYPDRIAILFRDSALSYGALFAQVNRFGSALRARGIGRGEAVAVLLPNCPQFTVAYYGCAAVGAMSVPANPLLKPAELEYMWRDANVRLVLTAGPLVSNALAAAGALDRPVEIVCIATGEALPPGVTDFAAFLGEWREDPVDSSGTEEKDPAVCIYTSGTTGRPKGALLSHHNLTANCRQITEALRFDESDNFLCVLPLFHSFSGTVCQNTPLYAGARSTIVEMFHPARVLEAIETHRVTIFSGVPAMFGALLQMPPDRAYDFSSVRLCVSGGAPMSVPMMQAFEQRFKTILIEGDGPTECSPVTSVNPPDGVRKPGSVGLPLPGVEIKIFDDNDRELPTDEVGEIVVRGENLMLGYLNQPEATAEAMRGGWYHTGDLGKIDSDGYVYIVDRKKDMLIVGGLNVYPREVEEILFTHAAVADAAVIGAPDALRGEEVLAVVVLKPGSEATDRQLIAHCRERLANYKVPRKVLFRESLPRGGKGNVLKRLLRKELDME